MKKILYYFISIIFVILGSLIIAEIILQIIPVIYRNLPDINSDKQYIYIIGESSAVGEPYNPKISYYKIFNYMINGKINNKKIEFIELAEAGSFTYEQFYKYLIYKYTHPFKKGIIFIYCGKNDWTNEKNGDLPQYSKQSILCSLLGNRQGLQYDLEKIILLAKKFGDTVFISTIEGNYEGFMPNLGSDNDAYNKEFKETDNYILKGKYQKASELLDKLLLTTDANKSWIFYRIGKICKFTGKIKEANDNFIKSVSFHYDFRPTQCQNEIIKDLAKKYQLELVDIFGKLYNSGEIIGFNFYMDNQHPNLKTYMMIARLFVDMVSKKYNVNVNIKRYNSTEREIFENFYFKIHDEYRAYRHSLDVTLIYSKEKENSNIYVFDKVEEYLKQIDLLNPYDEKRKKIIKSFYNMMYEALKGNKEKVRQIFNDSGLINEDKRLIEARPCDWKKYNKWVSDYLGIQNFFDLSKRYI